MKNLSLIIVLLLVVLHVHLTMDQRIVMALSETTATMWTRLTYNFVHANWIHLSVNCYCLLSLSFLCNTKDWQFVTALIISYLIPSALLGSTPILGISVINYALTGLSISESNKMIKLAIINLVIITAGMAIAGIAVAAHMYGFFAGLVIGRIINMRFDE